VVISSGIAGSNLGRINKSNNGVFLLGGKNQYFRGYFTQTGGTTAVTGEYFTGVSSITAGLLEISTGANISAGTIDLSGTGKMLLSTPDDLAFTGNVLGTVGTTISKVSTGTLTLSGSNGGFKGTYRQTDGTTTVRGAYFVGLSSIAGTSALELEDGTSISTGTIVLYDKSIMNINMADDLGLSGDISGTGEASINKTGAGKLTLRGNNGGFEGTYRQTAGTTTVRGQYFVGLSSIASASALEFTEVDDGVSGAIDLYDTGKMLLSNAGDIEFSGQVSGTAETSIDKSGAGILTLSGTNGGFVGTYVQSNGTTTVGGEYFAGVSSITSGSVLEIVGGGDLGGGRIDLLSAGQLLIKASDDIGFSGQVSGTGDTLISKSGSGKLTLSDDNSGFGGTYVQSDGITTVGGVYFGGVSSITSGSVLEIVGGGNLGSGRIDLLSAGQLLIGTPGEIGLSGQVSGTGDTLISKSGSGKMTSSDDICGFGGTYVQSAGITTVGGEYFAGVSSITNGSVLEIVEGGNLGGGRIDLLSAGQLLIGTPGEIGLSGQVSGTAGTRIDKSGTGTLTLSGSNEGFRGEFKQTAGETKVPDSAYLFKGLNVIEDSTLEVTMRGGAGCSREIDYEVLLSTSGILKHKSEIAGSNGYNTLLTTGSVRFIGDNGCALFEGRGLIETWYVLGEKFTDSGVDNEVQFDDCYIDVDSEDYIGSTRYRFTNSTIDIDNERKRYIGLGNNAAVSEQVSTRTVKFGSIKTSNSYLNTLIVMVSSMASGSQLVCCEEESENPSEIQLGILTIGEMGGESGHIETHKVRLLEGDIVFKRDSSSTITSMAYEYLVTVDSRDCHNVIVDARKVADGDSLNNMNLKEGNRALMFSYDDSTHTYYPNVDLEEMGSGRFYVEGHDAFDGESKIVARSSTSEERVSLFKVTNDTEFELVGTDLISAQGERGAALSVTTNTARVLVERVTFSSNTARGEGGGAIYGSSGADIVLRGTKFIGNRADGNLTDFRGNGGALNIEGGTVTLSGVLEVRGNIASGEGGGIYIRDGVLNVGVDLDSAKVFEGNIGNGESNAIYLEGDSQINFGDLGEEGIVSMKDCIGSRGEGGQININGATVFNLETVGGVETRFPNLNIKNQSEFNILGDSEFRASNDIRIEEEGRLRLCGRGGRGREIFVGNSFLQGGIVEMNLFGRPVVERGHIMTFDIDNNDINFGLEEGESDLINVEGGRIVLSTTSQLVLNSNDAFDNSNWRAYKLMKYGGSRTLDDGEFGDVQFNGTLPKNHIMRYDYLGQYIALIAQGYGNGYGRSIFEALDLCFNQTEVAKSLSYFYAEAYNEMPAAISGLSGSGQKLGDELQEFISKLGDGSVDGGASKDIVGLKEIFFDLSGYFISNVIISNGYDDERRDVYSRIYNYKENEEPAKGLWCQAKGVSINTDKDVESPYKFEVSKQGLLAGFDMMTSSRGLVGVYVKNSKSTIMQGREMHKGEVESTGVGLYGGLVEERWDIKGLMSCSADNYETTRCLRFKNKGKAEGKFRGMSAVLDIEGGYRLGVGSNSILGNVKLRPYIGGVIGLVHTKGFRESGGEIWNLEVKANNYLRGEVCGGLGFTGRGKRCRWNASCGLGYMLAGKKEEITSKFEGGYSLPNGVQNIDFKSRSVTLDVVNVLGDIGFGYYVLEGLEAYCGGDVRLGSMLKDFCANIGVRYSFGKWIDKKDNPIIEKKVVEVKTENEKIKQFRINAVLFEFDKAEIKPEAEKEIRDLAKKIGSEYEFEKIRIEGHTDSHGSDEYNKKLSMARAQAVYDVFAKYGIDVAKMEKIGHGESNPIDRNDNEKGRANNRRVEIFVDLY
jgi:predicted outer membrane repeat protein